MPFPPPPEAGASHCPRCFLPHHLCLCADIPQLRVSCELVVVRHWYESWRITNTGRLLALAIEGCQLVDHGHREYRIQPGEIPTPPGTCLLYPLQGDEAPRWSGGRPQRIIVPDGSWAQARRMVRRVPGLWALPRLELPPGPEPARRIRRSPNAAARCTIEAVATALALWEPPETAAALSSLYDRLAERIDLARGYSSSGSR
jgi:DTW domain-containing protein YfiP